MIFRPLEISGARVLSFFFVGSDEPLIGNLRQDHILYGCPVDRRKAPLYTGMFLKHPNPLAETRLPTSKSTHFGDDIANTQTPLLRCDCQHPNPLIFEMNLPTSKSAYWNAIANIQIPLLRCGCQHPNPLIWEMILPTSKSTYWNALPTSKSPCWDAVANIQIRLFWKWPPSLAQDPRWAACSA